MLILKTPTMDDLKQKLKDIESGKRKIVSVDWSKYRDTFPDKYMKVSEFDHIVWNLHGQMVRQNLPNSTHVLEIGSGTDSFNMKFFTHPDGSSKYYALDPYCGKGYPSPEDMKFDLVLCRGTLGYLTETQIQKMVKYAGNKGIVILNTLFIMPAEKIASRYKSKQGGGIEYAEPNYDWIYPGLIHVLIPDDDNLPAIRHKILYYSFYSIVKLARIANPKVKIASYLYKNNSIAIAIGEKLSDYKIF